MHKPDLPSTPYLAAPAECSEESRHIYIVFHILFGWADWKKWLGPVREMYLLWKGNRDNAIKMLQLSKSSTITVISQLDEGISSQANIMCFAFRKIQASLRSTSISFFPLYPSSYHLTSVRRELYIPISFLNNREEGQQSWMRDHNTKIFNI